jgi:hypothetical protein
MTGYDGSGAWEGTITRSFFLVDLSCLHVLLYLKWTSTRQPSLSYSTFDFVPLLIFGLCLGPAPHEHKTFTNPTLNSASKMGAHSSFESRESIERALGCVLGWVLVRGWCGVADTPSRSYSSMRSRVGVCQGLCYLTVNNFWGLATS